MALESGTLRYAIQIMAPGSTQDAFGQLVASSSKLILATRAAICGLTGKEVYVLGAGFASEVTHKITIRWPGITIRANMTVVYEARTFRIQAVQDPDERKRQLDLICLELDEGQVS